MFKDKTAEHELQERIKWYRARETFFGDNFTNLDIPKALTMMKSLQHEEAKWLCELFHDPEGITQEIAHAKFSSMIEESIANNTKPDVKLRFYWLKTMPKGNDIFSDSLNIQSYGKTLEELAEEGYVPACADMASFSGGIVDKSYWATLATKAGEPKGYFWRGYVLQKMSILAHHKSKIQALECYRKSAELGWVQAMSEYAKYAFNDDPEKYYWLGRAASLCNFYVDDFKALIKSRPTPIKIEYRIGEALYGHSDYEKFQFFGKSVTYEDISKEYAKMSQRYIAWCSAARKTIMCWTGVAMRFGVAKDIRLAIAKWLWEKRSDADYVID